MVRHFGEMLILVSAGVCVEFILSVAILALPILSLYSRFVSKLKVHPDIFA
jgi:uncharacterized membrane protein YqhA